MEPKRLASNKKTPSATAATGGGGTSATTTATSSGLDAWLQRVGKSLPVGATVRIPLVAGPRLHFTADPVDANAPHTAFPCLLKFSTSTVTPDFVGKTNKLNANASSSATLWKHNARLYQKDVPPVEDDEDEVDNNIDNKRRKKAWKYNRNQTKPRQWILQEHVEFLETMLQQRRKQKKNSSGSGAGSPNTKDNDPSNNATTSTLSSRYEGISEFTPSQYVLFSLVPQAEAAKEDMSETEPIPQPSIIVRHVPSTESTINMVQPAARHTMTLLEAEQAIEDQRMGIVRQSQRLLPPPINAAASASGAANSTEALSPNNNTTTSTASTLRYVKPKDKNSIRSRLLNKIKSAAKRDGDEDDDGDDVMANVTFRGKSSGSGGANSKARRELLSTLGGDGGITISDDGAVLGGSNDAAFGGRGQRFGASAVNSNVTGTTANSASHDERGADGAAMADDFYTRDVGAEYDELDYDANEQFDDDDVDVGETELLGLNDNDENEDEVDDDESDDEDDDDEDTNAVGGAAGLATVAGFKALLAKARGEVAAANAAAAAAAAANENGKESDAAAAAAASNGAASATGTASADANASSSGGADGEHVDKTKKPSPESKKRKATMEKPPEMDHMSKILAAAEKSKLAAAANQKNKEHPSATGASVGASSSGSSTPSAAATTTATTAAPVIAVDEQGLRYITLEAVRREIWLNHGSIPITRLIKIFAASKKHGPDRQAQFRNVVKELCTMTTDPVHGRMLVLKQHYSHMS